MGNHLAANFSLLVFFRRLHIWINAGAMGLWLWLHAGKVHGSLARAGKVRGQTPKVAKQDKKKKPRGRAYKRMQHNRRFVTAGEFLAPSFLLLLINFGFFCLFRSYFVIAFLFVSIYINTVRWVLMVAVSSLLVCSFTLLMAYGIDLVCYFLILRLSDRLMGMILWNRIFGMMFLDIMCSANATCEGYFWRDY